MPRMTRHGLGKESFLTYEAYWDCDCGKHYIHRSTCQACLWCGAEQGERSDARVVELFDKENYADCITG